MQFPFWSAPTFTLHLLSHFLESNSTGSSFPAHSLKHVARKEATVGAGVGSASTCGKATQWILRVIVCCKSLKASQRPGVTCSVFFALVFDRILVKRRRIRAPASWRRRAAPGSIPAACPLLPSTGAALPDPDLDPSADGVPEANAPGSNARRILGENQTASSFLFLAPASFCSFAFFAALRSCACLTRKASVDQADLLGSSRRRAPEGREFEVQKEQTMNQAYARIKSEDSYKNGKEKSCTNWTDLI